MHFKNLIFPSVGQKWIEWRPQNLSFFSPKPERKKVKNTNDTSLIFDITHEEIKNKKQVDDISLNGAKLIREQLNISENSKIKYYSTTIWDDF